MTLLTALNLITGTICAALALYAYLKEKKVFVWCIAFAILNLTLAILKLSGVY